MIQYLNSFYIYDCNEDMKRLYGCLPIDSFENAHIANCRPVWASRHVTKQQIILYILCFSNVFFKTQHCSNIFLLLIFMDDPNSFQSESMLDIYDWLKTLILQVLVNLNEGKGQTSVSNWNGHTIISPHRWVHPVLDYNEILLTSYL